ncbi:MAG TPA: FAD-dependent oxidoreductase [Steroidobacteraceae bacterium]|jgi:2-polyprenyl-6-methoxyphenol hydroxylase-like FAD-dependent oxidoreductase|nr:FAD-dependent oxidoreductase [Steroidobacteraceae bacterium]
MKERRSASVGIVGGGPVGLCLAIDLAWRGIDVAVIEQRYPAEPPSVKCNHISSRTMEIFRRLGVVREIRDAGLPHDYPNDVVFRTRATGYELTRIPIPCRRDRYSSKSGPDTSWPTPEPAHRINQIFFEPILFRHAKQMAKITLINRARADAFDQTQDGVHVRATDLDSGGSFTLDCRYLVGCDGGRSGVRRQMGARLAGDEVIQRVQSSYIRAPTLLALITPPPAWMSYLYNPERAGNLIAIDGHEKWLIHNYLLPHEQDFEAVDRDRCIRTLLGVGSDFQYELLAKEDWVGRRLVANRLRERRVFICGDAAHLWVPYAGYGMNAGIADAMNLSWQLAAHLKGWAPEAILDAYQRERLPITDQVSRFAMKHAEGAIHERTHLPPEIEEDSPVGAAARARVGKAAYELNVQQFACAGLNYGYFYDASPIIAYDDEAPPHYTMHDYTPSTVPGCRTPHIWLADGRSLYDAMGPDYTLLRFDPSLDVTPLTRAASECGLPLAVLDVRSRESTPLYRHKLLLSRPDQHVAWRGDAVPAQPRELLDLVRGAGRQAANTSS